MTDITSLPRQSSTSKSSGTPLISVIVPNRGRLTELRSALRSVAEQHIQPFEVLVVDDGSPNRSEIQAMLQAEFPASVRLIDNVRTQGASGARNTGILESRGDLVALLDSDDEWLPEKLQRQLECLHGEGFPDVVGCPCIVRSGNSEYVWPKRTIQPGENVGDYLFVYRGMIQTSTLLLTRDLLVSCLFNEGYGVHQDYDLLLRLQERGAKIAMVQDPLSVFNYRPWELERRGWSPEFSLAFASDHRSRLSRRAWRAFVWRTQVVMFARTQGRHASLSRLARIPWRCAHPYGILSWIAALIQGPWKSPRSGSGSVGE